MRQRWRGTDTKWFEKRLLHGLVPGYKSLIRSTKFVPPMGTRCTRPRYTTRDPGTMIVPPPACFQLDVSQ
eukprot:1726697-Rhodomonas_salina.1